MAKESKIQWCDSTANLQMGCEGCELIKGQDKPKCYAKTLTDRYAGLKGWPEAFEIPKIFPERLKKILSWSDLTGTARPDKPWLNNLPRIIFLNDMGDTFSKGMPDDWFAEYMPALAASPHIYMLLTKWPNRLARFEKRHPLPKNIWPGTSVTSDKTKFRALQINDLQSGGLKWLSVEPLWTDLSWDLYNVRNIDLFIYGGESGPTAEPFHLEWMFNQKLWCKTFSKSFFLKQLGANPFLNGEKLLLKDGHGGDIKEWPGSLRLRQFPSPIKKNAWQI